MTRQSTRRQWIQQSSLAFLGLGLSTRTLAGKGLSIANEEGLLRNFGKESGLINLGSNENPYGVAPGARQAILDLLDLSHRYQYNVPSVTGFKKELAAFSGVSADQVLITAGSGDGLGMLARHFSNGNIVTATPTFGILPSTAKSIGTEVIEVPLTEEKVHDLPAMLKAINSKTSLVYICNPANPTATILKPSVLKDFCKEVSKKATVLIDEAYIDYLDAPDNESMIPLTNDNPNVIVIRTFSKIHAMAGLRIGYTIAHPSVIKKLADNYYQRSQFACSVLSLGAAMASLRDEQHRVDSKEKNRIARDYTYNELKKMNFKGYPSYTNFIFFKLGNYKGNFADDMLKKNIVLRSSDYADGQWGRVSIGTLEEMKLFINIMADPNNNFAAR